MIKKIFNFNFIIVIIFFLNIQINNHLLAEAFIVIKVNNEVITNKDIEKEVRYLIALNNQLSKLEKKKIIRLAKNSIINEKIKKIELIKYYKLDQKNKYLDEILKDFFKRLGIEKEEDFKKYLNQFNLNTKYLKKKLEIETVWNQYIYERYKKQVDINEQKIKNDLKKEISLKKKEENSYLLSEILFNLENNENKDKKYKTIKKTILEVGFNNAANIYSISDSAKFGGKIGWIKENNLSKSIKKKIKNLEIGKTTDPINIPGGYLILKLEDKKIVKFNYDFNTEFNKRVSSEKNRQLNQFSSVYFDKLKQNIEIYEK